MFEHPLPTRAALAIALTLVWTPPTLAQIQMQGEGGGSGGDSGFPGVQSSPAAVSVGNIKFSPMFVAVDRKAKTVSVAAKIENTNKGDLYVGIIGPPPQAFDNVGGVYTLKSVSGLGSCNHLDNRYIARCIQNHRGYMPNEFFTRIPQGSQAVANILLESKGDINGGILIYSMSLAVAEGSLSDDQSRGLSNISINLPPIQIPQK